MKVSLYQVLLITLVASLFQTVTAEKPRTFEDDLAEHMPMVGTSSNFPLTPWGIVDWVVGLSIGSYVTLQLKANNYDCTTRWTSFGMIVVSLNTYFNKPFLVDAASPFKWISFTIAMLVYLYSTYGLIATCYRDSVIANMTLWYEDYDFTLFQRKGNR